VMHVVVANVRLARLNVKQFIASYQCRLRLLSTTQNLSCQKGADRCTFLLLAKRSYKNNTSYRCM